MLKTFHDYKNVYRSLLALGGPIFIGNVSFILTGIIDTIMVAQHSTEELAASAFVNNVINAFITLGTGFAYGVMPLIGENRAKKNNTVIGGWLKNSVFANISTMVLLMLGLWVIYLNVEYLGQPQELIPLIKPYYLIVFVSVALVMVVNSFRRFFDGIACPKISMWILTTCNILNIVGNYVFIYGKFGMPEMGLFGAGLSTFLSRLIMLIVYLAVFFYRPSLQSYRKGFRESSFSKYSWCKLNVIGWPIGIQQGLESATFCITAIMIGWLGSIYLAAHQLVIIIAMFCMSVYMGIGSAVTVTISYAKGANDWEMVKKIVGASVHLILLFVFVICLVLCLSQDYLGLIFTKDVTVNEIVKTLLPILLLYQIGDSLLIVLTNALRGLADVKVIMWISFVAYFVIALPMGYIAGFIFEWGISGVWLAYPLGFACSALMLGIRIRHQINKNLVEKRNKA